MTGIITGLNDWGCQGAECFSKPWPPLYRYCYFYWLVDFTSDVKTLLSASFNSFTRTMGLMGLIEALRLKKRSKKWKQQALLLIDRFPGKVLPKDKCLPSYPITQNPSSYEQQHSTKVYSLIEVPFILLFMNCAWIRIHQRLIQLFPGVCLIRHYYSKRNRKLKWRKQLSDMRMLFWSFTSLQEKELYPLPLSHCLKTWRKIIISSRWSTKYLTCSRAYPSRHEF